MSEQDVLIMKLASIVVHADEYISGGAPDYADRAAIKSLMDDPQVRGALSDLDSMSLLPIRRDGVRYKANP